MRRALIGLYALAIAGASPAAALDAEGRARLAEARTGDMARMVILDTPREPVEAQFVDAMGRARSLDEWRGRVVLVNFWATWCPPCLEEMPSLDALQAAMAGDDFAVVAISTDRGDIDKPRAWMAENGIDDLALYHDADFSMARAVGLLGQPTTLLLDREGREIARYTGGADWDGAAARALIETAIAVTAAP